MREPGSIEMGLLEGCGSTNLSCGKLPYSPGKCKHLSDVGKTLDLPFLKNISLDVMPCRSRAQAGGLHGNAFTLGAALRPPGMGCKVGKASPNQALIFPPQPAATRIHGWGVMELGLQVGPKPTWAGSVPQLPGHTMEVPGRDHGGQAQTEEPASRKRSAPPRRSCSWKEICHVSLFTSKINLPLRQVNLRQNL